jgi:DNA invertase Pin-like site-specific DNA recombinase
MAAVARSQPSQKMALSADRAARRCLKPHRCAGAVAPSGDLSKRAAQYIRMSTEHQEYSPANQADAIARFAAEHGLELVLTYLDEGRSGLSMQGRVGLSALLADVVAGRADYGLILVYDVSRWGRFQDCDEAAHYEYLCRRAGIRVEYCMEPFRKDGTPMSTVIKGLKRVMAGEYSRELSEKVFAGKCRLIRAGYRQGGSAGYGLRRMVVDAAGSPRRS